MGALPACLACVIDGITHQLLPQQNGEVAGTGNKGAVLQPAVVGRRQGVVENDTVGNGRKGADFVQRTNHFRIGGSPGVAACAGIAGLGDPHLAAGGITIPVGGEAAGGVGGGAQVLLAHGTGGRGEGRGHHGGHALGDTVVVVIAENIQLFGAAVHQVAGGAVGQSRGNARGISSALPCPGMGLAPGIHTHGIGVGVGGADDGALGIVLPHPLVENILIPAEVCGGVALGEAGGLEHIGLVDELDGLDGHAHLPGQVKDQLCLGRMPGLVMGMEAVAVGNRDLQLAVHSLDKVQQVDPLLLAQVIEVALGQTGAFEIIIGPGGPGSGDANPALAQSLGQLDEPGVGGVDGVVPLVHGGHALAEIGRGNLFGAIDLCIGVGFPEGSAGDLCHLHIVADQHGILLAQLGQSLGIQLDIFSHRNSPFSLFSYIISIIYPHCLWQGTYLAHLCYPAPKSTACF